MKFSKIIPLVLISLLLVSSLSFTARTGDDSNHYPDTIDIRVKTDINSYAESVANGSLDVFVNPISGSEYDSLDDDIKNKTEKWRSETGYTDIFFNPANTVSPYECDVEGELVFNPFAIKKIRYASNFLLNRTKIVEDFYDGHGGPRYLPISTESPSYDSHFEQIISEKGLTATGDLQKGKRMVKNAMYSAMNDTHLEGVLRPPDGNSDYWEYKPPGGNYSFVEINAIVRSEYGREDLGVYFSDILEDCGLWVNIKKGGAASYSAIVWSSDPADLQWGFYTGGWYDEWYSNTEEYYNEFLISQMYAGWYGYMPGGFIQNADYDYGFERDGKFCGNRTLENITNRLHKGQLNSKSQYWDFMKNATRIGLEESVRVFICSEYGYYLYNDGLRSASTGVLSGWSEFFTPRTIKTKEKTLGLSQFSEKGRLYHGSWNEIRGSESKSDKNIKSILSDTGSTFNPMTGNPIPVRCNWYEEEDWYNLEKPTPMIKRDFEWYKNDTGEMKINKNISVPEDAVVYNTSSEQWEKVGPDTKSAVKITYNIKTGNWHSGRDLTIKDLVANYAFMKEITYEDGSDDK